LHSQLRALAARNLRAKSPLGMRLGLPHAAEAWIRDDADSFVGGELVSIKKAKGKDKGTVKKSAKKSAPKTKKPVDLARVRENINNLVGDSAEDIATQVITVAKTGQLASAKYLFEVVGLYPATEQTAAKPQENSLAHTLLQRMGLPLEPVVRDEDLAPVVSITDAKGMSAETTMPGVAEDLGGDREEGQAPVQAEDEE
jgi:hypothetical protein